LPTGVLKNPHIGCIFPSMETRLCGRVATRPYNPANPDC
jgi:hypothetical protein